MKKHESKVTRFAWYCLGGLMSLLILAFFWKDYKWDGKRDIRIGMINDTGLIVMVISPERRMVNKLVTVETTPIWINGGYGYYEANKIKKLLLQEKKVNLAQDIFFYNFGVRVDKIEWDNKDINLDSLGILGYIRFRLNEDNYLSNQEYLTGDKEENERILDEVAVRDLADSRILESNIKVSVYNGSDVSGLAGFLGKRLDWMGLTVIGINTSVVKEVKVCKVISGEELKIKLPWNCEKIVDKNLNVDEMEIYFGENFAKMLQYF
jgi:hypothetical protein